jgi:hypothetical protein
MTYQGAHRVSTLSFFYDYLSFGGNHEYLWQDTEYIINK